MTSEHSHGHRHGHSHNHSHSDCCTHPPAKGKEAAHIVEAAQVRSSWLASAMSEAEEADRTSGVWELATDKWEPGDMVQIEGLKSRADLNGTTGVLIKWNAAALRWAVTVVATDEKVKVRPDNLRQCSEEYKVNALSAALSTAVLSAGGDANAEAAGASGMAPVIMPRSADTSAIAAQLAAEQYAVVDGFLEGGGSAVRELLHRLRGEGELQLGEVAGGRAAAAYARIIGQPLPRGDLMRFLEPAEAAEHAPLAELMEAMDTLVAGLERAPDLEREMAGCTPLVREEVQLTCYPGDGTQYVRHVDNNADADAQAAAGGGAARRGGRHITAIYYANLGWQQGDGGALRLHTRGGEEGGEVDVDVPPLGNRLVCFWSNQRVPHSVQPSHADRFAVSAWYHDPVVPLRSV